MEENLRPIARFMEAVPFNRYLGLEIEELRPGYARARIGFREEFIGDTRLPALHGGVISCLVDACGGAAVWTHFGLEDAISTVDIRVDYLRPGGADHIIVESEVKRLGNRVAVVDSRVFSEGDRKNVFAEGRAVYNIRRARSR